MSQRTRCVQTLIGSLIVPVPNQSGVLLILLQKLHGFICGINKLVAAKKFEIGMWIWQVIENMLCSKLDRFSWIPPGLHWMGVSLQLGLMSEEGLSASFWEYIQVLDVPHSIFQAASAFVLPSKSLNAPHSAGVFLDPLQEIWILHSTLYILGCKCGKVLPVYRGLKFEWKMSGFIPEMFPNQCLYADGKSAHGP